jgi:hypothetical protein
MVSPLKIYMALDTHFSDHRRIDKMFILGAMGPVTGQTLHSQVLVPRVFNLLAYRVRRVFLPIVARPAEIYDRGLFQQESIVRRMGDMAAGTVPFLYRRMFCLGPLLPLDGVAMTRTANSDRLRLQKAGLGRCVRVMAAQASLPAHHRPVHLVLAEYLIHCSVMASPA